MKPPSPVVVGFFAGAGIMGLANIATFVTSDDLALLVNAAKPNDCATAILETRNLPTTTPLKCHRVESVIDGRPGKSVVCSAITTNGQVDIGALKDDEAECVVVQE